MGDRSVPRNRRLVTAILWIAQSLLLAGCVPEIAVYLETTLYRDGSLDRRIEVAARDSEGKVPPDEIWLREEAGIALVDPDSWDRIEAGPGYLAAEGFFPSAEAVPGTLVHLDGHEPAADRNRILHEAHDLVVLTHRIYRETYGDPYGREHAESALRRLLQLFLKGLHEELRRSFGDDLDPAPVDRLFLEDVHSMVMDLMEAGRMTASGDAEDPRPAAWNGILRRYGVTVQVTDPDDFWDDAATPVVDWLGREIAASLSTRDNPMTPGDLDFWPPPGDAEGMEKAIDIAERAWGGEEELDGLVQPLLTSLMGYYADDRSGRYRFEARVRLPGTVLTTNGTPDGDGLVWIFRAEDFLAGDRVMLAETAEPDPDSLRALGARRDLEPLDLLWIVDLLARRDEDGGLAALLAEAVRMGDLELLREGSGLAESLRGRAVELADRLDPEAEDHPSRK